ncbi:FAD/NAD(P)-binding domain-containing protein [Clathrospora elynae]|uniref:FAD/NAD(P)-binding domain-containing protein n=1 Tax=Clathrospora elynae TaxID=706981 RepID=A0A6A5SFD6_9PLEO|nr:FAD/NAD(P)-binding domain-containing protein [Clathrospora elynae]
MGGFKVIIAGGGLAGALLANGLSNNGVDFMIYERDEADSKREGYQIRLGPGSQAGFRACLTNAHIDKVTSKLGQSSGSQATAPSIYNTQFDEILDLALVPTYSKSAAINRVILRDILLEPIKKSKRIQYRKGFDRYEIVTQKDDMERVKVHFSDGSHDVCDVLVGADGANSKINKQLGLNNLHLLDSHWAFLSKGSLPFDRMMKLPPKLREGPILVLSKDIILYYALYLPEGEAASEYHQAADTKKPLQYDEKAASFYWTLNVPVDTLPYKKASEIQNHRKVCLEAIKDWAPEFHHMLSVEEDDPEKTDMLVTQLRASTQPKANWRTRAQRAGNDEGHPRVWVMGDAIHAMQPNRGQGGNQALADCADMLPQLLHLNSLASIGPAHPTFEEIKTACDKYEGAMISRAFLWVKKSGGVSFPRINLDGFLGIIVRLVATLVIPLLKLYYSLFAQKSEE